MANEQGRVQTQAPQQRARRQPQARLVDTAVGARRVTPADMGGGYQLADALKEIQPSLVQSLDRLDKIQKGEAERKAMEDVMSGNVPDPKGSSDYFRFYQKQKGRITAMTEFDQELRAAYAEEGLHASDNPDGFREWTEAKRKEFLDRYKEESADFKAGMMPLIEQSVQNLGSHHAAALAENVVAGQKTLFADEAYVTLTNGYRAGMSPAQLAASLNAHNDRFLPLLGGSTVNEQTIAAVTNAAIQANDEGLLEVLDHIKGGSGSLGKTQAAQVAKARAIDAITGKLIEEENRAYIRTQRARDEALYQSRVAMTARLVQGETAASIIRELGLHQYPGLVETALSLENTLNSDTKTEQQEIADMVEARRMFDADPSLETIEKLNKLQLLDREEANKLLTIVHNLEGDPKFKEAYNSPAIKEARETLPRILNSDPMLGLEGRMAWQNTVNRHEQNLVNLAMSEAYQKANPIEQTKMAQELTNQALVAQTNQGLAPIPNPAAFKSNTGTPTANIEPIVGDPATTYLFPQHTPSELRAMAEEVKTGGVTSNLLTRTMELNGYPLDMVDEFLEEQELNRQAGVQQQGEGTPQEAPQATPQETPQEKPKQEPEQESFDPAKPDWRKKFQQYNTVGGKVGQVLDFIGRGESGGRYNVMWSPNGGEELPLEHMTIAEVISTQRHRTQVQGYYSSAAGKYQFIRDTLTSLVERYRIPTDHLFTPDIQDTLAILLMAEMGLGAYLKGRMPPEQFAHKLATQWAALPKDESGRGVYDQTKHNRANRDWGSYYRLLNSFHEIS